MKKLMMIFSVVVCICLLAGCAGTTVVYHNDCNCPTEGTSQNAETVLPTEGELKTGLVIVTGVGDSSDAQDADGEAKYDVTMVAVLVDQDGIIYDCTIDGIATSVKFDAAGQLTTDISAEIKTKNELGADYGMVAYAGAIAEWDAQAEALAQYAVGKTVDELKNGAIDETGKAPAGSDLASSATIYLGGYVSAIELAVQNAEYLGASAGDTLKMATLSSVGSSVSAAEDNDGVAQLDATVTAITLKDGVITSCAIDSVQAKVSFNAEGKHTTDLTAEIKTKNELGADYGMVAYAGAIAEWNEQVASFAKYVTGKTPAEVAGIAVDQKTAPTDADLSSSVTIAIGDFQKLIEKAAQ